MSSCPECDANLNKARSIGSTWNFCSETHCQNLTNYMHAYCNCQGPFSVYPYVVNGVCMTKPGDLVPIVDPGCYCCCDCMIADVTIAISKDAAKPAHDFNINDMVWVAKDPGLKKWMQKPVLFSSGTGATTGNRLIKIHFDSGNTVVKVTTKTFISGSVSAKQSAHYYKILSTAPNNFIGKGGLVDEAMVSHASAYILSQLLDVDNTEASRIYSILSPGPKHLLVTPDQPFLMQDGTLKQAHKLVPGKDMLVGEDGSTMPLLSLEAGLFKKGIHRIATSTEKARSLDGHLLLANGVVIGDYATQIGMTTKNNSLEDKYKDHPALGTEAYIQANAHLLTTASGAFPKLKASTKEKLKSGKSTGVLTDKGKKGGPRMME